VIISVQQVLVSVEIRKGDRMISVIEKILNAEKALPCSRLQTSLEDLLEASGAACVMVMDAEMNQMYFGGKCRLRQEEMSLLVRKAIQGRERSVSHFGTVWGTFWKQARDMALFAPVFCKGNIIAGAGVVLDLEEIYLTLRRTQHILSIYILINTIVLTLIGLHRLSNVTVKPVQRLLKRAEEYDENSGHFLLNEKENNEFSQLSKALNRMLKRISEDKKALHQTVQSLEQANRELRQAQKDIIRAEKLASVGRLASGLAHEIGNPISIVIGYLDLLKRSDVTPEENTEFITRAEDEISRINIIIGQLLDFSRPSDDKLKPVSIREIIEDITNVLKIQPLMSNICLTCEFAADRDTIMANPNRLRQVFLNLAINAADAIASVRGRTEGRLTIRTELASDTDADGADHSSDLKIMFMDNGSGIPEENIGNIFDPFYTTKAPGKGTGLGLSVSFMIIEAMGGKMKAISQEGKGTTMIICLPLYHKPLLNSPHGE